MDLTDNQLRPRPRPRIPAGRPVPQPVQRTFRLGRAAFLGLAGASAALLFFNKKGLPNINLAPGAESAYGFTIYTVTAGYPAFSANGYRLQIDGMVKRPMTLTIDDVLRQPSVTETRFYQCVTGWTVPNAKWEGVRLSHLLDQAQPLSGAGAVKFYSFDGVYTESLTMAQARKSDVLLAYKLMDKPLSRAQGAPLRLVVPGMYGYKFAKWVNRIELIPHAIDGYWEQNGYDRDAYIGRSNGYSS
jgi:DMSO/TMAO reductase YedYZ molybdopterin-dependent catalytic subunit